jgi:hypothetical protein
MVPSSDVISIIFGIFALAEFSLFGAKGRALL